MRVRTGRRPFDCLSVAKIARGRLYFNHHNYKNVFYSAVVSSSQLPFHFIQYLYDFFPFAKGRFGWESPKRGRVLTFFFFIETSPQPPNHFYKVSVKLPLCRFENSFDPCSLNLKFQVNFLLRRPPFPTRSICYYSLRSRCFTLANDTQTVRGGVSAFLFKFRVYPYTSPLKSRKINF